MQRELDYRVVIDTTPTLIFSARPDGYVDYVNRAFLDYIGAPFDDLEGSAWAKFVHPDDLEAHARRWREALASGEPAISEARYRTQNGEYRWLRFQTKPLRDDRGEVIRWFGAATDVEHSKRAEETLRNAERDVRMILETIPAIVRCAASSCSSRKSPLPIRPSSSPARRAPEKSSSRARFTGARGVHRSRS